MSQILRIPKPSQLDDWHLYEKLEKERIKQTQGEVKFVDWAIAKDQERIERDHWRRSRDFKTTLASQAAADEGKRRANTGQIAPEQKGPAVRRKLSDIDMDLDTFYEVPEEQPEESAPSSSGPSM